MLLQKMNFVLTIESLSIKMATFSLRCSKLGQVILRSRGPLDKGPVSLPRAAKMAAEREAVTVLLQSFVRELI